MFKEDRNTVALLPQQNTLHFKRLSKAYSQQL
jgi:hypothetical protein